MINKSFEEADEFVKNQFKNGSSGLCSHYGRCDVADLLSFIYNRFSVKHKEAPSIVLDLNQETHRGLNKRWE